MLDKIRANIRKTLEKTLLENVIVPPDIPGTMNFWHGGNLDFYDEVIAQKNGSYEYGPGLYVITDYAIANKYAKGGRKFYLITVAKGNDIQYVHLPYDAVINFVKMHVTGHLKKSIIERLQPYNKDGIIKAYIFNNIILNEKAIKASKTIFLRQFYIDNGIDYEFIESAFGGAGDMLVLYNMKKIVKITQIQPTDKILKFDLR